MSHFHTAICTTRHLAVAAHKFHLCYYWRTCRCIQHCKYGRTRTSRIYQLTHCCKRKHILFQFLSVKQVKPVFAHHYRLVIHAIARIHLLLLSKLCIHLCIRKRAQLIIQFCLRCIKLCFKTRRHIITCKQHRFVCCNICTALRHQLCQTRPVVVARSIVAVHPCCIPLYLPLLRSKRSLNIHLQTLPVLSACSACGHQLQAQHRVCRCTCLFRRHRFCCIHFRYTCIAKCIRIFTLKIMHICNIQFTVLPHFAHGQIHQPHGAVKFCVFHF